MKFDISTLISIGGGTKCRNFDNICPHPHMGEAKAPANQMTTTKLLAHLLGQRIGRHVKILGFTSQQHVTHTATHQIGLIAGIFKAIQHLERALTDIGTRNGVFRTRYNFWNTDNRYCLMLKRVYGFT